MAKILVVDDSPSQTMNISKILKKHGHDIITADDGEAGVEMALLHHPDLILMDVVMPKLNGFQATRKITHEEATKNIPVILVTTKNEETDEIWGIRQGAKAYILKPVEESILMKKINEILGL